ncbi:MAG: hypothetical protein ACKVVT_15730 [Dehalococcoidia bacterium]
MATQRSSVFDPLPPLTEEYVRELIGDPAEDERRISHFQKTCDYFHGHQRELRERYMGRWIIVHGCGVVGDASSLEEAAAIVRANPALVDEDLLIRFMRPPAAGSAHT